MAETLEIRKRQNGGLGTCRSCEWFNLRDDDPKAIAGYCRRYPPAFREDDSAADAFPNVRFTDWCGEYQIVKLNREI